jgi:adenosylcobinamide-phosphate synthase
VVRVGAGAHPAGWAGVPLIAHYSLLLALAFDVLVLYLTLGFRQFSHYFTDIRDALDRGDETWRAAAGRMAPPRRQRTAAHRGAAPRDRARAAGGAPACVRRVLLVRRAVGPGPGAGGAVLYRMAEFAAATGPSASRTLDAPANDRLLALSQRLFPGSTMCPRG